MGVSRKEMLRHLAQVDRLLASGLPLTIGAVEIPGTGARVVMGAGGKMLAMGLAEARDIARSFDVPLAREAGLTIADDLRAAADAIESHGATKQ